jgi:Zn-dependent protease
MKQRNAAVKWSWKIAEFRGIGVYVHATFLILIGFVVASHWAVGHDLPKTLEGVAFVLALFACVVLHEFGHALTAARYGIRTRDITLLPIGGVARLERMPEEPWHELWVALAGPAVNIGIAAALFVLLQVFGATIGPVEAFSVTSGSVLERLLFVNLGLAAFNLLPAFPMDGGRVLRAALATRLDYTRATQIAASAGQAMALLFGLVGFFTNPFLMFIALFVWIGAAQEAGLVEMRAALAGIPVVRAMETVFRVLAPNDSLGHAVEETLASAQQDFPVLEGGILVGLLTRQALLEGLARRGAESTVAESMLREYQRIEASEMLDAAFRRLEGKNSRTMPVMHAGTLVGLVTLDNVGDVVAIRSALEGRKRTLRTRA